MPWSAFSLHELDDAEWAPAALVLSLARRSEPSILPSPRPRVCQNPFLLGLNSVPLYVTHGASLPWGGWALGGSRPPTVLSEAAGVSEGSAEPQLSAPVPTVLATSSLCAALGGPAELLPTSHPAGHPGGAVLTSRMPPTLADQASPSSIPGCPGTLAPG